MPAKKSSRITRSMARKSSLSSMAADSDWTSNKEIAEITNGNDTNRAKEKNLTTPGNFPNDAGLDNHIANPTYDPAAFKEISTSNHYATTLHEHNASHAHDATIFYNKIIKPAHDAATAYNITWRNIALTLFILVAAVGFAVYKLKFSGDHGVTSIPGEEARTLMCATQPWFWVQDNDVSQ